MKFRVIIKNGVCSEIFNDLITAKNENEAIKIVLEKETICSGDTIIIDEE